MQDMNESLHGFVQSQSLREPVAGDIRHHLAPWEHCHAQLR